MELDSLSSRRRQVELFEMYGALLTEHQREVLELYLGRDWSLSEIAHHKAISRAAVHDLVRRAARTLDDYERRLELVAGDGRRRAERAALAGQLGEIRRRLSRLEQEFARV